MGEGDELRPGSVPTIVRVERLSWSISRSAHAEHEHYIKTAAAKGTGFLLTYVYLRDEYIFRLTGERSILVTTVSHHHAYSEETREASTVLVIRKRGL